MDARTPLWKPACSLAFCVLRRLTTRFLFLVFLNSRQGLALAEQVIAGEVPTDAFDRPLDAVVTPDRVFLRGGADGGGGGGGEDGAVSR